MDRRLSPPFRLAALLLATTAALSLGLQLYVDVTTPPGQGVMDAAWSMARYFTNLTNAMVVALYLAVAVRGAWPGVSLAAAVTVWIVAVGAVYHALLAATHHPEGIGILSNIGMHTLVPLGVLALWAVAAPKDGLSLGQPVLWTAWPLGYALYALARGRVDGDFPYFFLDPLDIGIAGVAAYTAGLGVFFVGAGTILVLAARWRRRT